MWGGHRPLRKISQTKKPDTGGSDAGGGGGKKYARIGRGLVPVQKRILPGGHMRIRGGGGKRGGGQGERVQGYDKLERKVAIQDAGFSTEESEQNQ